MRGRAGLLAAVLGTALVPGLVAAQEDATPTPTETAAPTETPTSVFGQAPQPPRGMHLKVDWDGTRWTLVVTWDPSPGAESYSIERAEIDGPWQQPVYAVVATVEQSEKPTFRDPNSDGPVGYYCYRITAIGRGSNSDHRGTA